MATIQDVVDLHNTLNDPDEVVAATRIVAENLDGTQQQQFAE